jgi:hypothetical protein
VEVLLLKQSLSGGYALEKSNLYANYIHLQSDGFRQPHPMIENQFICKPSKN